VLSVCFALFQKNEWRGTVVIFICIFLIGQAIGYGFNLKFLKIYSSINNGRGYSYSLASIVIPIMLVFIVKFSYKAFNKKGTK
jgi:hypothetical protein